MYKMRYLLPMESVLDLIKRAYTFGLNLTKLDIRQESSRHGTLLN